MSIDTSICKRQSHCGDWHQGAGPLRYIPVINGTVFVIGWNADSVDHRCVVGINDLGPAKESYHRASLSVANGRLLAHTLRELICIKSND